MITRPIVLLFADIHGQTIFTFTHDIINLYQFVTCTKKRQKKGVVFVSVLFSRVVNNCLISRCDFPNEPPLIKTTRDINKLEFRN